MKRAVARAAAAAALVVVGTVGSAYAQQLPRTGSIAFHTGWKFTGELKKLGPAHMQGHGTVSGVTFNDSGSGPLHLGPANCFDVFFVVGGRRDGAVPIPAFPRWGGGRSSGYVRVFF